MIAAFLGVSCVVLVELLVRLDMRRNAVNIAGCAREAFSVMASSELEDETKERFVRSASASIFRSTGVLTAKLLVVGVVLFALYSAAIGVFPDLRGPIHESLISLPVLFLLSAAAVGYLWVRTAVCR